MGLGEFETVMQTRDEVEGLQNCRDFVLGLQTVETSSRVCITVENSPSPSSVYIRICKHRKKVFYCFYKITFPRKKAKLSCFERKLKEKFLCVISRFVKKMLSKKRVFLSQNFISSEKKLTQLVSKDLLSFNRRGNG